MHDLIPFELRDRAGAMARYLRLDTLGNLHVEADLRSPDSWRITAGDPCTNEVGFVIRPWGEIHIFGSYAAHVSPWLIEMG